MEDYLSLTRSALKELQDYEKVHVVMGNESCDLDSTISALVYAYYLYTIDENEEVLYIPLMQIPRKKFRLRVENVHFLDKVGIPEDYLTFYEDLSLQDLYAKNKLSLTLLDHHVLKPDLSELEDVVAKVIDHRPVEKVWTGRCKTVIEPVGSCCTLVAEEVLQNPDFPFDGIVNVLLYGTILIDTINMSPEAGRTTAKDEAMLEELEESLAEMGVERDALYEDINAAKYDLSGLTTMEILEKDAKFIESNNLKVAMSSITMDIADLFSREDLDVELKRFAELNDSEVVVLMTLSQAEEKPCRQLALYSNSRIYKQQINDVLLANADPSLSLEVRDSPFENIVCYNQGNLKASRKKVLPIIKGFLNGEQTPDESTQPILKDEDHVSFSSVAGGIADSGKGESDHEQHFLSNETMSPEMTDDDPFSPQSINNDSAYTEANQTELLAGFDNTAFENNHPSIEPLQTNKVNNTAETTNNRQSETSGPPTNSHIDVNTVSNDPFCIEAAGSDSSLCANQLDQDTNNNANNITPSASTEEDNFELTEADMYNSNTAGTESPLEYQSGPSSATGSKLSSYPVTPPNSYMDSGFLMGQHDLPSFNSSEMVGIIKAKQASMGIGDLDDNEDMEPFTPANSYVGGSFDSYFKETNLPSFQKADLIQKVKQKRASLDIPCLEGDEINPFPYTPPNSYVDRDFDQAQNTISGLDLTEKLQEKGVEMEPTSESVDGEPLSAVAGARVFDLGSKQSTRSDLLNMGFSKSGSSDMDSVGDINSPSEIENPGFSHYDDDLEVEGKKDMKSTNPFSDITFESTQDNHEAENAEAFFKDLISVDNPPSKDNVVALQLSQQLSSSMDDLDPLKKSPPVLQGQSSLELLTGLMINSTEDNVVAQQLADDIAPSSGIVNPAFSELDSSKDSIEHYSDQGVKLGDDFDPFSPAPPANTPSIQGQSSLELLGELMDSSLSENVVSNQVAEQMHQNDFNDSFVSDHSSETMNQSAPLVETITSDPLSSQLTDIVNKNQSGADSSLLVEENKENVISRKLADEMSQNQDNVFNQMDNLLADSQVSENVIANDLASQLLSSNPVVNNLDQSLLENETNDNVAAEQIVGQMRTDADTALDDLDKVLEDASVKPSNLVDSGTDFTKISGTDELSTLKSDERLLHLNDTIEPSSQSMTNVPVQSSNPFAVDSMNENTNPFSNGLTNPFATEDMAVQQEKDFDPFSTISSEGHQIVSGFDDDFSSFGLTGNDKPEEDQLEQNRNSNNTDHQLENIDSTNQFSENLPSHIPESSDLQPGGTSDVSASFETGLLKESNSSMEDLLGRSPPQSSHFQGLKNTIVHQPSIQSDLSTSFEYNEGSGESYTDISPVDNREIVEESLEKDASEDNSASRIEADESTLHSEQWRESKPVGKNELDKIKERELIHQPSIQSDLSTSFEDRSEEILSSNPVSPDVESVPQPELRELKDDTLTSDDITENTATIEEVIQPTNATASQSAIGSISNEEEFSSNVPDIKNTGENLDDEVPKDTLRSDDITENIASIEELIQPTNVTTSQSAISSISNEKEFSSNIPDFQTTGENKDDEVPKIKRRVGFASSSDEESPVDDRHVDFSDEQRSGDNDQNQEPLDPLLEEEIVRTSNKLVENAFKEAIDIHKSQEEEFSMRNEVVPLDDEEEEEEEESNEYGNTLLAELRAKQADGQTLSEDLSSYSDEEENRNDITENTDTRNENISTTEQEMIDETVNEVAFNYANELIKEALDTYDEVMEPVHLQELAIHEEKPNTPKRNPPLAMSKNSNSLSLETDYLPGMDPLRGSLDIYSASDHSSTISTDAQREVAESVSFRKISGEESPNQHREMLEKLRDEAEKNRHDEQFLEERLEAMSDSSQDNSEQSSSDWKSGENSLVENIPSPAPDLNSKERGDIIPASPQVNVTSPSSPEDFGSDSKSEDAASPVEESVMMKDEVSEVHSTPSSEQTVADNEVTESQIERTESSRVESAPAVPTGTEEIVSKIIEDALESNQSVNISENSQEEQQSEVVEESMEKINSVVNTSGVSIQVDEASDEKEDEDEGNWSAPATPTDSQGSNTPSSETSKQASFTDMSKKEKKEVYMTSAGRISISVDNKRDSLDSTEGTGMGNDNSPTSDPWMAEEHRQDISEMFPPTPVEPDVDIIKQIAEKEDDIKSEIQDDELPPITDGQEVSTQVEEVMSSSDGAKADRPTSLLGDTDIHTKKKIVADIHIFNNEDGSEDDILDDLDEEEEEEETDEWENDTPARSSASETIGEYTAAEEMEDAKHWKVVNVGDKEYRIDLHVIEPYKKVISHGGYYGDGLNAIIVFSGCYLPDKRRKDYQYVMDHLFVYVVHTLEELVADDYMIVYFHGATPKKQSPSFGWLKKCYQMIDRRLKKNLKSLFLVHPTLWLRTVVLMTKPFISSKFSSKLKFVKTLQELGTIIPMQNLNVPDVVKTYDEKIYQSLSTPSTPSSPS